MSSGKYFMHIQDNSVCVMVFNATCQQLLSYIVVVSFIGEAGENHRPAASR
jgi:hypothetical protein